MKKALDVALDIGEFVILAIFIVLTWISLIPLFPENSQPYWIIFGFTIAYLLLLFIKLLRKYVFISK